MARKKKTQKLYAVINPEWNEIECMFASLDEAIRYAEREAKDMDSEDYCIFRLLGTVKKVTSPTYQFQEIGV